MATPDETKLQKGALAPAQQEQTGSQKAVSLIDSLITKPSLPTGTTISPQLQQVATTELMATPGVTGTLAAATPTTAAAPTIAAPTAGLTGTQITAPTAATAGQITAAQVAGQTPTMTAAQGQLSTGAIAQAAQGTIASDATVKGQLAGLQQEVETALASGNPLPVWARGAAKATEAALANRGLSASSMAAEALAEGIMNSAVPIAAQDAATYKQMIFQNLSNNQQAVITNAQSYLKMDLSNLSNRQQTNLQNINARQNFLLSDQAAANAAFQFNATSQNQVNQFYSKLATTVADQNAARIDAMRKFAEAEKSKINALNAQNTIAVNEANAKREETVNRFNATLANQRQQFNVQNQREIDQSNVVWRRAVNTANTAAVNASNQTNAQNLLNLSNWGLSSAWQQWRDEASWVNTSSENEANRNHNLAIAALERSTAVDLQNKASKDAMYQMIGKFGFDLLSGK
ncbi:hypothetical protein [Hyphomonas sp.]|uniref:hypothetical protein n=1 Tax=Hyphomonas sp. TaxID=87 RepID=UPI000C93790C|nr:hypothetical protein [Hyphomonas sp.]MAL42795.1 hypothetical protein [Hyphomonas sp.]